MGHGLGSQTLSECPVALIPTPCPRETGARALWTPNWIRPPSRAGGPGPPGTQEMPGPQEGSDLGPEPVVVLPQLGGDRAAEASAESTVTEGSPDSGWRSRKDVSQGPTAGQGWPGNRAPVHRLRCSGRFVCWGDRVGRWRGLSPFTVLAQKEDRILSGHLTSPSQDPGDGKDHRHLPAPPCLSHQGCSSVSWDPSQYI